MNPEELAKFQALFTMYKKQRRLIEAQSGLIKALEAKNKALEAKNKALKEGLLADSAAFEAENAEIFETIHRNHKQAPMTVTVRYG